MTKGNNYFTYTKEDIGKIDAVSFMDKTIESMILEGAKISRRSPRTFIVSYTEPEMESFRYEISRRDSRRHFTVKLTLTMYDGTAVLTRRYKDITVESLAEIIQNIYGGVKRSRSKAMNELGPFRTKVTDSLLEQGYSCIGSSNSSMAFRGNDKNVSISISELGLFKAVVRFTRKVSGVSKAFETGAPVSVENADKLVQWIGAR